MDVIKIQKTKRKSVTFPDDEGKQTSKLSASLIIELNQIYLGFIKSTSYTIIGAPYPIILNIFIKSDFVV